MNRNRGSREGGGISDQLDMESETEVSSQSGRKNTREVGRKTRHAIQDMIFLGSRVTLRRERITGDFQSDCALVTGYGAFRLRGPISLSAYTKSRSTRKAFHGPLPVLAPRPPLPTATHVAVAG